MSLTLQGCNKTQAKLLAIYFLERSRLGTTITFTAPLEYIDLDIGQAFVLRCKSLGINNQWFRVISKNLTIDGAIQFTAIVEKDELYDDIYEPNIYDIDLTTIVNPIDIWYDQTYIGNARSLIKMWNNKIQEYDEKDLVILSKFLAQLPISRYHSPYFSGVYYVEDNEVLGDGEIIIYDHLGHLKVYRTYNYHYGYGIAITPDYLYISEYPYTSNNNTFYEGRRMTVSESGVLSDWELLAKNPPSSSFVILPESRSVITSRIRVEKNSDDGSIKAVYYSLWKDGIQVSSEIDIKDKAQKLFMFTYGWYNNGNVIYGSIIKNYYNGAYFINKNSAPDNFVDITSIISDFNHGFSFQFIQGKPNVLYYLTSSNELVKLDITDLSSITKTVIGKIPLQNSKLSWCFDRGDTVYCFTEAQELFSLDKETDEYEIIEI
jgi:hypothetical protein